MSFGSGLGGFLGGLFGDSGSPYEKAMEQYKKYMEEAQGYQKPFYDVGQDALNRMKSPTDYYNNLVGGYQQTPYNKYLQDQSMRAGTNAASASGLIGSTPFLQQQQQNATNIGQQGLDQYLASIMGMDNNLLNRGQSAGNNLTQLLQQMATYMGQGAFGQQAGKQQDMWNTIGGGLGFLFG